MFTHFGFGVGREIKFELVKKIIILSRKTLTRLTVITETRKPSIVIEEGIHTKHRTERERESHMKIHRVGERETPRWRDTKSCGSYQERTQRPAKAEHTDLNFKMVIVIVIDATPNKHLPQLCSSV